MRCRDAELMNSRRVGGRVGRACDCWGRAYGGSRRITTRRVSPVQPPNGSPSAPGTELPWTRHKTPKLIKAEFDQYVCAQEVAKRVLAVACYNHQIRMAAYPASAAREEHHRTSTSDPLDEQGQAEHWEDESRVLRTLAHNDDTVIQAHRSKLGRKDIEKDFERNLRRYGPPTPPPERPSVESGYGEEQVVLEKSNIMMLGPTGSGKTLLAKTLASIMDVPYSMSDCTPFTQAGYVGEDVEQCVHRLLIASNYDVARAEQGIICLDEIDKITRRSDASLSGRDVSGEGVQQALLKILEGTVVTIHDRGPNRDERPRTGAGLPKGQSGSPSAPQGKESYTVDTSNILFILTGAFNGLDKIVLDRVSKGSMGFGSALKGDTSKQRHLLESSTSAFHHKGENTEALAYVQPEDLVKYGFIPEFVGRVAQIVSLHPLSEDDLVRVITEPKNAIQRQYTRLFELCGVELRFTRAALSAIARRARDSGTGARGIRRIMDACIHQANYETPGSSVRSVLITRDVVLGHIPPHYFSRSQAHERDRIQNEEDAPVADSIHPDNRFQQNYFSQ